jgi:predicted transcriptional regulator
MISRFSDDVLSARSTARVVAAYVTHREVSRRDLAMLIPAVNVAMQEIRSAAPIETPDGWQKPAVPILTSVQDDQLTCLECGCGFALLRQHLAAYHGLTPRRYREKWSLGAEYPMITPEYTQRRSELAKASGLGRRRAAG